MAEASCLGPARHNAGASAARCRGYMGPSPAGAYGTMLRLHAAIARRSLAPYYNLIARRYGVPMTSNAARKMAPNTSPSNQKSLRLI